MYNLTYYQDQLNFFYHNLLNISPNANKTFSIIKSRIQHSESFNDMKRDQKFENLLKLKMDKLSFPIIKIYNLTDIILPENIEKIILKSIHQPVGGRTNKNLISTKFEEFFESWRVHAEKNHLDIFKITKVRSQLYL